MSLKSDSYEWIGVESPHADGFRAGVERNGNAKDRCPICDGRRLHRTDSFGYCKVHRSWTCWHVLRVACHVCRLRWGVIVKKCEAIDDGV